MPVKRLCDGRDLAIFFGALFEETSWECWDVTTARTRATADDGGAHAAPNALMVCTAYPVEINGLHNVP
jgi:hypothetical protein